MKELLSAAQIAQIIERLAREIIADMPQDFTVIALMDGAFVFAADLMRALHRLGVNPEFESFGLSSYGDEKTSSGKVAITALSRRSLTGKTVLILDDVLETGRTLNTAAQVCISRGAINVKICVIARKPIPKGLKTRALEKIDFIGWDAPDEFLVGYGLDDAGRFRGQDFIGSI